MLKHTLRRRACAHCGMKPSRHRWTITACANKGKVVDAALCDECDVLFNQMSLEFIHHPDTDKLIARYRRNL